jgi:hypothetical protein
LPVTWANPFRGFIRPAFRANGINARKNPEPLCVDNFSGIFLSMKGKTGGAQGYFSNLLLERVDRVPEFDYVENDESGVRARVMMPVWSKG